MTRRGSRRVADPSKANAPSEGDLKVKERPLWATHETCWHADCTASDTHRVMRWRTAGGWVVEHRLCGPHAEEVVAHG